MSGDTERGEAYPGLSLPAQVYHARELAARAAAAADDESGAFWAFSLHPGLVNTSILNGMNPQTIHEWCLLQSKPCPLTPDMGAATQTFLAVAPEAMLAGKSGAYFKQCVATAPPKWDAASQAGLFNKSLVWSGSP